MCVSIEAIPTYSSTSKVLWTSAVHRLHCVKLWQVTSAQFREVGKALSNTTSTYDECGKSEIKTAAVILLVMNM